ncbi:MAG: oxidoreductase [Leptospira sp.]|nr:oxidoreductase [Leptospira sp.]
MAKRSALILGSTGLIGGHCLDYLLEDDSYGTVIVAVRKETKRKHKKLKQVVVDFENLEKRKEVFKVNDVFCCLGTTIRKAGSQEQFRKVDLEYPVRAAELSAKNGVKQFSIVSAMGADRKSMIFYNRIKGEVESEIQKFPFSSVMIFRPSLLTGEREEVRSGEKLGETISNVLSFAFIGPFATYRPIEGKAVAHAMVLESKKNVPGKRIYESGEIRKISEAG